MNLFGLPWQEFGIESDMREDVFAVVESVRELKEPLGVEDQRLLDKMVLEYKRNGLGLPKEKQELLKEIKKKMSQLSIQFSSNMNEDATTVIFTEEELDGVPADYLKTLQTKTLDNRQYYVLTMKYPDLFTILKMANNEETRRRMELTYNTKCKPNLALLEEVI